MIWLKIKEVAQLEGISERAIQIRIQNDPNYYVTREFFGGKGRGIKKNRIALESLTEELQEKYLFGESVFTLAPDIEEF